MQDHTNSKPTQQAFHEKSATYERKLSQDRGSLREVVQDADAHGNTRSIRCGGNYGWDGANRIWA